MLTTCEELILSLSQGHSDAAIAAADWLEETGHEKEAAWVREALDSELETFVAMWHLQSIKHGYEVKAPPEDKKEAYYHPPESMMQEMVDLGFATIPVTPDRVGVRHANVDETESRPTERFIQGDSRGVQSPEEGDAIRRDMGDSSRAISI